MSGVLKRQSPGALNTECGGGAAVWAVCPTTQRTFFRFTSQINRREAELGDVGGSYRAVRDVDSQPRQGCCVLHFEFESLYFG